MSLPSSVVPDIVLSHCDSPVDEQLVADLLVAYAFDQPTVFTMVANRDLERLDLDMRQLREIALTNLRRMIPLPELKEVYAGVGLITCGGDFEATTLLLDEVWKQIAGMVEGDLTVAVPARDVVLFTGSTNHDGLAFMRSKVSEILETGDHILTRHFLVRREGEWSIYTGFAE